MIFKKMIATALISGTLLLGACSLNQPVVIPISASDVAAVINLVAAFNGFNGQITTAQLTALQNYLSTTPNPEVLVILQMLAADGVLPTGSILTPVQLAAIVGLLDALGLSPVINGVAPTVAQMSPQAHVKFVK